MSSNRIDLSSPYATALLSSLSRSIRRRERSSMDELFIRWAGISSTRSKAAMQKILLNSQASETTSLWRLFAWFEKEKRKSRKRFASSVLLAAQKIEKFISKIRKEAVETGFSSIHTYYCSFEETVTVTRKILRTTRGTSEASLGIHSAAFDKLIFIARAKLNSVFGLLRHRKSTVFAEAKSIERSYITPQKNKSESLLLYLDFFLRNKSLHHLRAIFEGFRVFEEYRKLSDKMTSVAMIFSIDTQGRRQTLRLYFNKWCESSGEIKLDTRLRNSFVELRNRLIFENPQKKFTPHHYRRVPYDQERFFCILSSIFDENRSEVLLHVLTKLGARQRFFRSEFVGRTKQLQLLMVPEYGHTGRLGR